MAFAQRMVGGGGAYDGLGSGFGLARAHKKSRPLTISDQGATLRVTTLIRTGFDAVSYTHSERTRQAENSYTDRC